jgi:hypothetical protein
MGTAEKRRVVVCRPNIHANHDKLHEEVSLTGAETFYATFILKPEYLPRQARGKHRQSWKRRRITLQGVGDWSIYPSGAMVTINSIPLKYKCNHNRVSQDRKCNHNRVSQDRKCNHNRVSQDRIGGCEAGMVFDLPRQALDRAFFSQDRIWKTHIATACLRLYVSQVLDTAEHITVENCTFTQVRKQYFLSVFI